MPLPPVDPFGPSDAPWDAEAAEPQAAAPAPPRQQTAAPQRQPQQPPMHQPVDRLNAMKGVLHAENLATEAAWQMQALSKLGWDGEPGDGAQVRQQLEIAVRELHAGARRLSAVSYWMHSQRSDT